MAGVYWVGTNDGNIQVSKDGGFSFTEVGKNIPGGGTHEYHVSGLEASWFEAGTAYAAAEFGFFVSLNDGGTWHAFMPNLPKGRIDEVVVHPSDNDLVLAHHGRSV